MYLEPIFSSEDINRQLPVETRKFNTMQRNWRRIMKNAYDCPYVSKINLLSYVAYISQSVEFSIYRNDRNFT